MSDAIKKKIMELKPGHELLDNGKRVFRGGKQFTEQVPSEFVRSQEPSKKETGPMASTDPGNNSDTPMKAAKDSKATGTPQGSGPAASGSGKKQ